ncbi:MAG: hypothetical protein O7C01_03695, partial [Actinobacteria bacterium]|nr:hypothetical protein [Actinomycetota bacterium]
RANLNPPTRTRHCQNTQEWNRRAPYVPFGSGHDRQRSRPLLVGYLIHRLQRDLLRRRDPPQQGGNGGIDSHLAGLLKDHLATSD